MPRGRAPRSTTAKAERIRRRLDAEPELELTREELEILEDQGIDPADVRRIARDRGEPSEPVSDHDRDTARDEVEALLLDRSDEPPV